MMPAFRVLTGTAAPLLRVNIDTDCIIPGSELLMVSKTGFGEGLFAGWRYAKGAGGDRTENPDFILNREPYRTATILLAGRNFACGSSREMAVWALRDFGFRCVIAPSYGFIFYANCFQNGVLAVELADAEVESLARQVEEAEGRALLTVDLETCRVIAPDGSELRFSIAENFRVALLEGRDFIDATLAFETDIAEYERRDRARRPWIYQRP
ncbi:MAG: 3-isopropylmalate dehydratase small subunit [Candidatus Binatia bacterium]